MEFYLMEMGKNYTQMENQKMDNLKMGILSKELENTLMVDNNKDIINMEDFIMEYYKN